MSIDLYNDFNEEFDAQAGDYDDEDMRESSPNPDGNPDGNPDSPNQDQNDGEPEKVEPKVIKIKKKQFTLNVERLKGPRGIIAVEDFYTNIKFKGKGYEKDDLNEVMKRLEHWAHRMYPKYNFDDSLAAIERLGKKKEVNIHMVRYRMGQLVKEDDERILLENHDKDDDILDYPEDEPIDEFEKLIDEQIALTTANSRLNVTNTSDRSFGNISGISGVARQPNNTTVLSQQLNNTTIASQQPQDPSQPSQLSDEVRARIAENRLKALAILEQKKKEAEEKLQKEAEEKLQKEAEEKLQMEKDVEKPAETSRHISNIYIDDDDF